MPKRSDSNTPLLAEEGRGNSITPLVDKIVTQGSGSFSEASNDSNVSESRYCIHPHYSDRAPWLRAAVLGANDGLVSVASIMLGVGAGSDDRMQLLLSGVTALVAGSMSMAVGEYISVSSQRDTEAADVEKEKQEQLTDVGRARELDELTQIYIGRGLDYDLARQVAVVLTNDDVIKAHARDELGIDLDNMANPTQAALSSMICFALGGAVPLLGGAFIGDKITRLVAVALASTCALLAFGAIGAWLGGAGRIRAAIRVLFGGWMAFFITFMVGRLFGTEVA